MKTSRQIRREAKQLFRLCLVDGTLDEGRVRQVVEQVLASRPRGYLLLLKSFQRWIKLEYARHTAEVESAVPLPFDLEARVRDEVEKAYGPGMTTLFAADPALIGGMRIQVASDVYDGSIRSALSALARTWGITSNGGSAQA
ncbi:MAG TPA: F0F1 ATP synthase subunit delta [Terriglobales bacterium]|nr:F0F1 ATP synthase subunit delta [Terriglobales bacterium]